MNEHGSFNWYRSLEEEFFVNLTRAIMHADYDNLKKIKKIFSHIGLAHSCSNWDASPIAVSYPITINVYRGDGNPEDFEPWEHGSFNKYLFNSGYFVTHMSRAALYADCHNRELIKIIYPQMIAALKMPMWYKCPNGFESPTYNSPPKIPQKTLDSQ